MKLMPVSAASALLAIGGIVVSPMVAFAGHASSTAGTSAMYFPQGHAVSPGADRYRYPSVGSEAGCTDSDRDPNRPAYRGSHAISHRGPHGVWHVDPHTVRDSPPHAICDVDTHAGSEHCAHPPAAAGRQDPGDRCDAAAGQQPERTSQRR